VTIAFGTDGWRGVIADDCTFAEIRRIAAARANSGERNRVSWPTTIRRRSPGPSPDR